SNFCRNGSHTEMPNMVHPPLFARQCLRGSATNTERLPRSSAKIEVELLDGQIERTAGPHPDGCRSAARRNRESRYSAPSTSPSRSVANEEMARSGRQRAAPHQSRNMEAQDLGHG